MKKGSVHLNQLMIAMRKMSNMKYPEIVIAAKRSAINSGCTFVVYYDLRCRWWNKVPKYNHRSESAFYKAIDAGIPLVKLLLFLPNGRMVQ